MRILNLYSENIKKIKVVNITPTEDIVPIAGKNGNGKSSTLDSIAMVLGGKALIPSKPVREGEEKAKISIDIGDYVVTRHWTNPETSYLKLENKDGANITNAQGILNRLIGDLSFDPLEFSTMKPDKRFDILRKLTKVDFTELDKKYHSTYESRADVAREGKSLKSRLETEFVNVPDTELEFDRSDGIEEIKRERQDAVENNRLVEHASASISRLQQAIQDGLTEIDNVTKTIDELGLQIESLNATVTRNQEEIKLKAQEALFPTYDLNQFDEKIEAYYEHKKVKEDFLRKKGVETDLDNNRKMWTDYDLTLKQIMESKKDMISNADMPIEGLSFGVKEVLYNDIPFAQLSMAEQIKVSVSIAVAMNPRLRVAMIYNGSLLDDDSMKVIKDIAAEKDMQIWVEKVQNSPDGNCVFIENGEVIN